MKPSKIEWYLGSASLAMIMEQERKHWLLKTDKKKQVQDMQTGDAFQGRIDNVGSDIVVETEKLPYKDYVVQKGTFSAENVSDILELARSVFPYTPMLNGLHFMRITSINLMTEPEVYHNYRLKLTNCEIVYVPMATGTENDDNVFVYRWLRTSDTPVLQCMQNQNEEWSIEQNITFSEGITKPVYYFPLDESLQVIGLTSGANLDVVTTEAVTSDSLIGSPLLWFTCMESDNGPKINMKNVDTADPDSKSKLLEVGSDGDNDDYTICIYPSTGDDDYVSPDGSAGTWMIACHPKEGTFEHAASDFTKPIGDIVFMKSAMAEEDGLKVNFGGSIGNNTITMSSNQLWSYVDEKTYAAQLIDFDSNTYQAEQQPLVPAFDVQLDRTLPFTDSTTDAGFVGMQFGSSKNHPDQFPRYPHNINNLKGLPDWIQNEDENLTPQHMSIYALHNTPSYNPQDQQTRQIAGLIFDPGVERTYDYHQGLFVIKDFKIVDGGDWYRVGDLLCIDYGKTIWNHQEDTPEIGSDKTVSRRLFYVAEIDVKHVIDQDEYGTVKKIEWATDITDAKLIEDSTKLRLQPDGEYKNVGGPPVSAEGGRGGTLIDAAWNINDLTGVFDTCWGGTRSMLIDEDFYNDAPWNLDLPQKDGIPAAINRAGGPTNTIIFHKIQDLTNDPDFQELQHLDGFTPVPKIKTTDETTNWSEFDFLSKAHGRGLKIQITKDDILTYKAPVTETDYPNEETGRVYLLSNDKPEYENNARSVYKKPDRTIARICDIPTSIMQLTNISGLAPSMIVDKKYIRDYASFQEEDLDYIRNDSRSRWVRPTALDQHGHPIYTEGSETQTNQFVFDSVDNLLTVDMIDHNDFRIWTNLNPMIDPQDVHVYNINNAGLGYKEDDLAILVIGGFEFDCIIGEVDDDGGVQEVVVTPPASATTSGISLANFNMMPGTTTGVTASYGTSPRDGVNGHGLKLQLQIDNWNDYQPKQGNVMSGMYAFVRTQKGIYLYQYLNGSWVTDESLLVAEANISYTEKIGGHVSVHDAYINSIIPSYRRFEVAQMENDRGSVMLGGFVTPAMMNITDTNSTPVTIPDANRDGVVFNETVVDINKFYCHLSGGLHRLVAEYRQESAVIKAINESKYARYESFAFWRWVNPNNTADLTFEFGVIYRSLDNLITTDVSSTLPENELKIDNFVNTNNQTTIVWNVPHIGPMVWMFDPMTTTHETYYVNAHTRDPYVVKKPFTWDEIEIVDVRTGTHYPLIKDGAFQYNLLTNMEGYMTPTNPGDASTQAVEPDRATVLYGKSGYRPFKTAYFRPGSTSYNQMPPRGGWRLVFPTNHNFKLKKVDGTYADTEYAPTQMKVIRGAGIGNTEDVLNYEGIPVNYASVLLDENPSSGKLDMRIYNQDQGQWESV